MPRPSFQRADWGLGSQRAHWRLIFSLAAATVAVRRRVVVVDSVGSFILCKIWNSGLFKCGLRRRRSYISLKLTDQRFQVELHSAFQLRLPFQLIGRNPVFFTSCNRMARFYSRGFTLGIFSYYVALECKDRT